MPKPNFDVRLIWGQTRKFARDSAGRWQRAADLPRRTSSSVLPPNRIHSLIVPPLDEFIAYYFERDAHRPAKAIRRLVKFNPLNSAATWSGS